MKRVTSPLIRSGQVVISPLFSEPMRVETVSDGGGETLTLGLVGSQSERFRRVSLTHEDLAGLTIHDSGYSYNGDGKLLRLGLQAYALGIAWEFDPYFGLSISRVDPLPHPERESSEVKNLRPNLETEATAMEVVMEHERERGCQVEDVSAKNVGYDVTSLDTQSGEMRLIEVKGLAAGTGTILWSPNEKRVAEDRRDCYWLYVVTNCGTEPTLQEPIHDPIQYDWHEVRKVQHYYLKVDAMTQPIQVREDEPPYGGNR